MEHSEPPQTNQPEQGESRRRPPKPRRDGVSVWSLLLLGGLVVGVVLGYWTLVVAVLGLALLITVHELGHFLAAKAFGMRVERFYVGFPPAAVRRTWGETEYGIGIIPLGGFCKISGMLPEEEVPEGTGDRVYYKKPIWQRNLTIFAGPFMNIVAAAVILAVFLGVSGVNTPTMTVATVAPGTPAEKAGLTAGITLLGADGQRWSEWDQATSYFQARPDETIKLTYRPEGQDAAPRTIAVTLGEHPDLNDAGYLGVGPAFVTDHPAPWEAVWLGVTGTRDVVVATFTGFWWLITGKVSATGDDGAAGVVGIMDVSQQAVEERWYPALLAFLSVNLAIINLLPILPFDGGHIAVNILEKVRRRRLDSRWLEGMIAVGTALLVLLFIFLTYNDLQRIFG
jgi:regulator of sigma E protease